MVKVLSAHQPDIFPYIGLFSKMNKSDFFDMAIYDIYSSGRYMDRVKMGALNQLVWVNVPIKKKTNTMIKDIELKSNWKDLLKDRIEKQYKNRPKQFPYYEDRKFLIDKVLDNNFTNLADLGAKSIEVVKDFIGIDVIIGYNGANLKKGTDGLIELSKRYEEEYGVKIRYLSGIGGKAYMELQKFKSSSIDVEFNDIDTKYKCSILTPLFKEKDIKGLL